MNRSVATRLVLAVWLLGCGASTTPPPPPSHLPAPSARSVPTRAVFDEAPAPRDDGRLPPGVKPTRYALDLEVDPSAKGFSGRVRIGLALDRPTRVIVMHGRGMAIRSAMLATARGKLPAAVAFRKALRSKAEPEELVLAFDDAAPAGDAELDIAYDAPFAEGLRGLYRVDEGGRAYAFTQFEPNDARRAFPCFDEPGNKTPFDLTLAVPKGSVAFANTREAERHADGERVVFAFEKSAPLPTYLVAFGVGPLDVGEGPDAPTRVRLVAAKGKAAMGKLSVEAAAAHLDLLGKYFDRTYPYSKLDIAAVPNFGAGAMENPGFVTFREELLLLDPEHVSIAARRTMASVVAHELAHQWFGDLVTMQWWDDLWLNEAFASWMSDKIVDQWRPDTRARLSSFASKSQVMSEDALATARKIRNPVRSTSEAEEAFDGITYSKGRAVLSMIEAWLGEDTFRTGLRQYIKQHEWGNATAADLYAALTGASGVREVAPVMNSFTDQTGVPLVTAMLDCQPGSNVVRLSQREYRTLDRGEPSDKTWRIPVCITYGSAGKSARLCTLLDRTDGRLDLKGAGTRCPEFLYANAGEAGYYRVGFAPADLAKLASVALPRLSEEERFGLVSNAWAMVWSGDLSGSGYLKLLKGFQKETSRTVWSQIVDSLVGVDRALISDEARPAFARFVRDLLGPASRRLGFAAKRGESDDEKLLRDALLGALGSLGNDEWALSEATKVANRWLSDPAHGDADLARLALPLAARHGDASLFDRLLAVQKNPATPEIRLLALSGLTGFEDPTLVERTLALTLDGTVKTQDFRYVLTPLSARRATRDVTFAWTQKRFEELTRVVPAFLRARLIRAAAAMCDASRVRDVETFFRPRIENLEGAEKNARQAVEEGLRCAALSQKDAAETSTWLGRR